LQAAFRELAGNGVGPPEDVAEEQARAVGFDDDDYR
jgi:hypothetical protein